MDECDKPYLAKDMCRNHYYQLRWRPNNREKYRQTMLAWQKRHPDRAAHHARRYRARKRGNGAIRFSPEQLEQRLSMFGGCCGICRDPITADQETHIDHRIPLALGGMHCLANLQPAHATCNRVKGARPDYRKGN